MPSLFTRDEETTKKRRLLRPANVLRDSKPYARAWWLRYFPTRAKARRAVFYMLLGVSAVFGCLFGLVLVNTADMPQMEDLEHYRPSTVSQLLDVHGRTFGSFALERRVVVPYGEFPRVLHDSNPFH